MLAATTSRVRPPEAGVRTPRLRDRPQHPRFPGERVRDTVCEATRHDQSIGIKDLDRSLFSYQLEHGTGRMVGGVDAGLHGSTGLACDHSEQSAAHGIRSRVCDRVRSPTAPPARNRCGLGELPPVVPSVRGILSHAGDCG
jgi:hypothetical protein